MKRYLKMAAPYKGALILTVLALLGSSAVSLVMPDAVRRLTGALTDGTATKERVLVFAAVILSSYIVKALLTFVSKYKAHVAAWNFVGDMMLDVYNKLQSLSMRFFGDKQTGEIMSRVINDSRNMETLIAHALPDLLSNILIVILVAIMIFSINPILAAISLIPIPLILFVTMKFSGKVHALFKRNQEVLAEVNGKVQDNISGIREIQSFGREKEEYMSMKEYCKRYSFVNVRANFVASIFFPTIEFLTSVGSVLVMGIGGTLALKDVLSVSDVVGFFMYLSLFYSPIAALSRIIEDMQNAFAGGHRVLSILDMESEIKDSENAEDIGRANGEMEFDHVSFYYNENKPVLKDISFKIDAGKMVAFVGATGVGKSTIVSLMERFYDPVSGTVRLDGKDIKDQIKIVENDDSKKAKEDASQKTLSDVLGKDYKSTLGVDAAYDLDYSGSAFPLSVTFEYKSAKSGDTLYVLQKTADGWKRLDTTVANGKLTVSFASADAFVIVRDTASSSSDSPKTGYNSALIAAVALVSLAGAAYATKHAVAAHN